MKANEGLSGGGAWREGNYFVTELGGREGAELENFWAKWLWEINLGEPCDRRSSAVLLERSDRDGDAAWNGGVDLGC